MILTMAERYAQRFIHFDMAELVQRHGTVISAGLFGAIAGSGVLPFERAVFTDIVAAGKGAAANLAAFEESFQRAASGGVAQFQPETPVEFSLPQPETPMGHRLLPRIEELPRDSHEVVFHGVQRLVDYQDEQYAQEFLTKVEQVNQRDAGDDDHGLTRETARWLALWMAFEDIPRVAQLKSRPGREAEIRAEVRAATGQPVQVTEFFHPRVEEVAALLPRALGEWLLHSEMAKGALQPFLGPRKLRTDKVTTGFTLRMLAGLRRMRRKTLGYAHEWRMIDRWFQTVCRAASQDHARAIADLGGMVKGYGATRHRTTTRLMAILDAIEQGQAGTAERVRDLQAAAMVGEDPGPLSELLASTAEAQAAH
jgi:indolepyruvate ferredoxin oxidoreductase beta subunit